MQVQPNKKKLEIKTIIDDIRQVIETYGCNHDEKTMNTLKRSIKKGEDLWCDEEDNDIEDLNICIRSLKFYKTNFFGEYQQSKKDNSTFIDTPEWINNKKCTINPQKKDNKGQYSTTLSLFYREINCRPETIPKIKPFINNLNWENINFPPQEQDFKTLEMNNKSIALNILQTDDSKKK